ncbi:DUF4383 domain-containing protein [Rhodococcus ruber]|uniref:Uncharacterized protein n=1 Tax=Rhodococcus ruber TaxID=1830 RepID=A0A098BJB2_9NOCA|nr:MULTISPECIES: DUF4383 domain-containing protein [Rhodococcus]MDO2377973.1 DUF4383 domain-containing protein [Rhodococcus ruber]RIK12111.1 MAG: DUF4383 domain-containing protein [Acidobacteriota bacterium]ATQ28887.1 DUF4383 domain-containing protein [Rhodococcus ruber]AUM17919.1 DUF4383 domain-containing protein [Rhodococcus ruber]AWH00310.1 DUF4383 domain-containing protein [Rhodococcus ruber]
MIRPSPYPRVQRTRVQGYAFAVGIVFLLIGALGFVPGLTSGYDSMTLAGQESHAHLLGLFRVSIAHNLLHLAYGAVGILAARKVRASRIYLIAGGAGYLALSAFGMVVGHDSRVNVVPVNAADNWLHLALGVLLLVLAVDPRGNRRPKPPKPA